MIAGYEEEACVICTDSRAGKVNLDAKKYKQSPRPPCDWQTTPSITQVKYAGSNGPMELMMELKDVFKTSTAGCTLGSCTLKKEGCQAALTMEHNELEV